MNDTIRDGSVEDVNDNDYNLYDSMFTPEEIALARADVLSWEDVARSATVLPELKEDGKKLIEDFLGYLPAEAVTIKYEAFLRNLIRQLDTNQMSFDDFAQEVGEYMKLIRNKDMQFNLDDDYSDDLYQNYRERYLPYIAMARQRLMDILGYVPELRHSIVAEMWLGEFLSRDTIKLSNEITPVDYKAMSLIRYREVLLAKGKDFADNWPTIKFEPQWAWEEGRRGPPFKQEDL